MRALCVTHRENENEAVCVDVYVAVFCAFAWWCLNERARGVNVTDVNAVFFLLK